MRSRNELTVRLALAVLGLAAAAAPHAQPPRAPATPAAAAPTGAAPSDEEIRRALATVEADPNLTSVRTVHTLRWRPSTASNGTVPTWLRWLAGFFRWFAETGRTLIWAGAVLLVGLLALYLLRLFRARGPGEPRAAFVAPSRVRDLDIRPETLPDDVGAAAADLWDGGQHRGALALLYRGLLSRLVHVHAVPIRDSSTEGDCLALARARVTPVRQAYAADLVGVWQVAVYGDEEPTPARVHALCEAFAPTLNPEPVPPTEAADAGRRRSA